MHKHRWFIPGNVPSSKNGRRWTGKYFIASKAVVNYRKLLKSIMPNMQKILRKR